MGRHSSFSDPRLVADFSSRLLEASTSSDFGLQVAGIVADLIPGSVISLDEIHTASGSYHLAHTLPVSEYVVIQAVGRLKDVYMQSPIHRYMEGPGRETILDLRELSSSAELELTDFYQDVLKPLSLSHQVAVILDRPGWTCTLTLNRDSAFEPQLKTFLRHISPVLIAAHRVACEVKRLRSLASASTSSASLPALTPREWEVFTWMREGKRNGEISVILGRSVRTIEKHVESILRKTGAETRAAAIHLIGGSAPSPT